MKPITLAIDVPSIGGKCWVLDQKGIFILEAGPGTLRTIACTHAGSGSILALDGIPDEHGEFPDANTPETIVDPFWHRAELAREVDPAAAPVMIRNPAFDRRNGRPIYRGNPAVMGSWMLDAGFLHGLTIVAQGGHEATPLTASIVWAPFRRK